MKSMLIKTMIMLALITPMTYNPLQMGIILLIQALLTTILINTMMTSSWFSLITFIMMIGGLLILFTYMSSIASNEKIKLKLNLTLMLMILTFPMDEMLINQVNEMQNISILKNEMITLSKMFNFKTMYMSMFMIMYLLLAMIMVSKMIKTYKGPLRSKYE
uniref:NADH dehydrogenase subunit 6 n=1 Tax=Olidiana tongmaiensis TaxID=2501809 RepID=A0A898PBR0_9HEMI|nr:NADH dehydrogenase subunit 6 [Olidiana tongmaiensis]QSJ61404.1 NADH dehydrogenase subunit 6 [Olidiana tongmaiensis]